MEPQRYVVVFDVNVYLDVARLLEAPFSWAGFSAAAAQHARTSVPHPSDPRVDSLRAVAACQSGVLAGDDPLEVWTSAHIDRLVRAKAQQPVSQGSGTGLGWSPEHAQALVADLVYGIVEDSSGGTLGDVTPDGNPPLDHEDGLVYGACRRLSGEDPVATVICVTRDRGFLGSYREGRLGGHTRVITPAAFVGFVRRSRFARVTRSMRPR